MIILRRILAVLLAIFFVPFFLVAIVIAQVNSTVLSSKFYVSQLRDADLFNWAYDEVAPAAFDEWAAKDQKLTVDPSSIKPKVIAVAKTALPPDWLEQQVEAAIIQAVPYVLGDTDSFTITVPLKQPIEGLGKGIKDLAADPEIYALAMDQTIAPEIAKQVDKLQLPVGIHIAGKDAADALKLVVAQQWVASTVATVVDQVAPYATGQSDHFTIVVPIADRIRAAGPATKQLLAKSGAYQQVVDQVANTLLQQNLSAPIALPLGVTVTRADVEPVLRQALSPDYVQQQGEAFVDALVGYLAGDSPTLRLSVALQQPKAKALTAVDDLVAQKLEQAWNKLPGCTVQQTADLLKQGTLTSLPPCRPAGVTFQWLKDMFGGLVHQQVQQFVGSSIPNEFVYTDADLRRLLGSGSDVQKTLDNIRGWSKTGYTFTDADLRDLVSNDGKNADALKSYDDAVGYAGKGFTFTQADLLKQMDAQSRDNLDDTRSTLKTARSLRWLVYLIPVLLLAGIAFLGGRSWPGRLAWGASVLAVAALLAFVAFGVLYQAVAWPMIDREIANSMNAVTALERILQAKALEMARSMSDALVGGLATRALVFLVIAVLGVAAAVFWRPLTGLVKRQPKAA